MKCSRPRRRFRLRRHALALAGLLLFLPALYAADENCPWLNAATAGGVLGGSVSTTIHHTSRTADDAVCDFSRQQEAFQYSLRISVQTMSAPKIQFASFKAQCATGVESLRAIGNEALACAYIGENGRIGEQIIGRVREHAFIVRITATNGSLTRDSIREKTRKIAEQVAGVLF